MQFLPELVCNHDDIFYIACMQEHPMVGRRVGMTGVMDGPGDAGSRNPVYELLQNQILSMELLPQDMLS